VDRLPNTYYAHINGIARSVTRTRCSARRKISRASSSGPIKYEPPSQAIQSAAVVRVFADAFTRAQSLDPETVRTAIAGTELETFFGPVKFDAAGRNTAKSMVLTQVQAGKHVMVFPAKWATRAPVVPRPSRAH
jgi:Periplasmic binding protein domain